MKRVLLLAHAFPPVGGAGVQRVVKLVKYLGQNGWHATVIAGPGMRDDRWSPLDRSLGLEVPADVDVHRVAGPEPRGNTRLQRVLGRPGEWARWWSDGVVRIAAALPPPDAVLATMSPFASSEAASTISRHTGMPWVADLRDPWALDEMICYPTGAHRALAQRQMRRSLSSAAAIVMNTPEAARRVGDKFPELAASVVDAIPNGFDPEDLQVPAPARSDSALRIVHTGYFHTELASERRLTAVARQVLQSKFDRDVDRSARSHVHLLRAMSIAGRDTRRPFELHLAGVLSDADIAAIPPDLTVVTHGYLDHAESVRLLRSADVLFLPMHDLPTGRRATIVPGKTFEYLASNRPILAAVPDGDARDLLAACAATYLCRPRDAKAMASILLERAAAASTADADRAVQIAPYSRERLARRMADVLTSVSSGGRPEPAPAKTGGRDV